MERSEKVRMEVTYRREKPIFTEHKSDKESISHIYKELKLFNSEQAE